MRWKRLILFPALRAFHGWRGKNWKWMRISWGAFQWECWLVEWASHNKYLYCDWHLCMMNSGDSEMRWVVGTSHLGCTTHVQWALSSLFGQCGHEQGGVCPKTLLSLASGAQEVNTAAVCLSSPHQIQQEGKEGNKWQQQQHYHWGFGAVQKQKLWLDPSCMESSCATKAKWVGSALRSQYSFWIHPMSN